MVFCSRRRAAPKIEDVLGWRTASWEADVSAWVKELPAEEPARPPAAEPLLSSPSRMLRTLLGRREKSEDIEKPSAGSVEHEDTEDSVTEWLKELDHEDGSENKVEKVKVDLHLRLREVGSKTESQAENKVERQVHAFTKALRAVNRRAFEEAVQGIDESRAHAAAQRLECEKKELKAEVDAFLADHGFRDVRSRRQAAGIKMPSCPLHYAVKRGNVRMVRQLLRAGADPAQKNSWGRTPAQTGLRRDREDSHTEVLSALATHSYVQRLVARRLAAAAPVA